MLNTKNIYETSTIIGEKYTEGETFSEIVAKIKKDIKEIYKPKELKIKYQSLNKYQSLYITIPEIYAKSYEELSEENKRKLRTKILELYPKGLKFDELIEKVNEYLQTHEVESIKMEEIKNNINKICKSYQCECNLADFDYFSNNFNYSVNY